MLGFPLPQQEQLISHCEDSSCTSSCWSPEGDITITLIMRLCVHLIAIRELINHNTYSALVALLSLCLEPISLLLCAGF
uniref:Uncharacterized protein n=1 Tax=Anguilla anguilla TaxID=7936 RepID=A0A0E9XKP4_ANGAN